MQVLESSEALPLAAVSEIRLTDPLNLTLVTLPEGIRIKLGYSDYEQKLDRLKRALPEIAKRAKRIESIDLRNFQGVALKIRQ